MESLTDPTAARVVVEKIVLERVHFYHQQILDQTILQEPVIDVVLDNLSYDMVVRMRCFVWGETVGEHAVSYPKDWWEAFKERWFPYSWQDRWPTKMKTIKFDVKAVYPTLDYSLPNKNPRLILMRQYEDKF